MKIPQQVQRVFQDCARHGVLEGKLSFSGQQYLFPMHYRRIRHWHGVLLGLLALTVVGSFLIVRWAGRINLEPEAQPLPARIWSMQDSHGLGLLHHAVINGNLRRLERLLQLGVAVDLPDDFGWSALHWAVFLDNHQAQLLLKRHGANGQLRSQKNWYRIPTGWSPDEMKSKKM